jgi:ankyrin repeat protein
VCLESIASSDGVICLSDIRTAIINGNADYLKQLMEKDNKFFVDTILSAGWTPLMYATNGGHKHIVDYLLERGADPNYHNGLSEPLSREPVF